MAPRFALALLALCVLAPTPISAQNEGESCAHVVGATASKSSSSSMENHNSWTISATVSSSETGWDKHSDEWKVEHSEDGTMFGTRTLGHPYVDEQPFTKSLSGVNIPDTANVVTISARDSVLGCCGDSHQLTLQDETATGMTTDPAPAKNTTTTNSTGTGTLLDSEEEYSSISATDHDAGSDDISMNSTSSSLLPLPPRTLITVQIENEWNQDEPSSTMSSSSKASTVSFATATLPSLMVVLWTTACSFFLETA